MREIPTVSIIIPAYNDEEWISAAIDSCLAQTHRDFEIICVDDASTDATALVVQRYCDLDPRVRLVTQPENASAYQARRVGVEAAAAPFVIFLDGDDELSPNAVEVAVARAREAKADVVAFGVEVVVPAGVRKPAFEAQLQPRHDELHGLDILTTLFPAGKPAHGHIWGYLFSTELLRNAYHGVSPDLKFYRANDVPITFLTVAAAHTYASTPARLYRYYFRRGTSGHKVKTVDDFSFYLRGVDSIDSIRSLVDLRAAGSDEPATVLECYESTRLSIIGTVLRYCNGAQGTKLQNECLAALLQRVDAADVLLACADFAPELVSLLTRTAEDLVEGRDQAQHVLLTTPDLKTGGVQAVVAAQAQHFHDAGFAVTIALHRADEPVFTLPGEVHVRHITGSTRAEKLRSWMEICSDVAPDVIIDHNVLYNRNWPFFALAARLLKVATIGWIHSFALRPLLEDNANTSFLLDHSRLLETMVTLSPTDVAFWKLRGIEDVVYLPNPLSQATHSLIETAAPKAAPSGPIKLVWWGRLHQSVKQVRTLLALGSMLRMQDIEFELTIIGPDTRELTAAHLLAEAEKRGIADAVTLLAPQYGDELFRTIANSDLLVMTSVIEGYSFAIVEAQALGLPVVMYDLPWLSVLEANEGVVVVDQGDVTTLASEIASIAADPDRFAALSAHAQSAARTAASFDFVDLYARLVRHDLPERFSPTPTIADASLLLQWVYFYGERNAGRRATLSADATKARTDMRAWRSEVILLRRQLAQRRADIGALRKQVSETKRKLIAQRTRSLELRTALDRRTSLVTRAVRKARRLIAERVLHATTPAKATTKAPPAARDRKDSQTAPISAPVHSSSRPTESAAPPVDVSVVVTTIGAAGNLERTLESVLVPSQVSIEVVCITTTESKAVRDIVDGFAAVDPRVIVVNLDPSDAAGARNSGIESARGRYITFLPAGDTVDGNSLARLVSVADVQSLDVLLFDGHVLEADEAPSQLKGHGQRLARSREYAKPRSGVEMMVSMRRRGDYRELAELTLIRTAYLRKLKLRFQPSEERHERAFMFALQINARAISHLRLDVAGVTRHVPLPARTLESSRLAHSHFVSYLSMIKQMKSRTLLPGQADHLIALAHEDFELAQAAFITLPHSIGDELKKLDSSPEAQMAFRHLTTARRQREQQRRQ